MTSVQSISVGLGFPDYPADATTPTTPRAPMIPQSSRAAPLAAADNPTTSVPTTPTNPTFSGISGQRPLPTSPFRNSFPSTSQPLSSARPVELSREASHRSLQSETSQDVDMDESEGEGEADGGSDAEAVDPETGTISKKKKGLRFFCTDYPPCKLSFTRSEHLARHIRKHTGERPFQCHCSRKFSRLDNLRQHAQTVHVNEDIPMDSLAATGTRFQRQVRTDRVQRPAGNRPRTSTTSIQSTHQRGHGRHSSTSSIGSVASTISRDDTRRRPPPLMMANDPSRNRLSLDILRSQASTPPGQTSFFRESSEGLSTPTSTTLSTGGNSPGYGSSIGSPVSNARSSGYWGDGRTPGRRLSVPSGPVPFHSPHGHSRGNSYGSPFLSPLASSQASNFSNLSSSFGSPTNATHQLPLHEAESETRRRTWHPTPYTYTNYARPATNFSRPATSGLSYYQTPDAPHPSYATNATAAASQSQRLPGIETFDPPRPTTPPSHGPDMMHIDPAIQQPAQSRPLSQSGPNDRRGHASWDMSLHQGLTKLDLRNTGLQVEGPAWMMQQQTPRATESRPNLEPGPHQHQQPPIIHQDPLRRPAGEADKSQPDTNRAKRGGWYGGPPPNPVTSHPRISPGESTGSEGLPKTPSMPTIEHHPSIMHSNGFVESVPSQAGVPGQQTMLADKPQPPSWPLPNNAATQRLNQPGDTAMSGLDALVAAVAREENTAARG